MKKIKKIIGLLILTLIASLLIFNPVYGENSYAPTYGSSYLGSTIDLIDTNSPSPDMFKATSIFSVDNHQETSFPYGCKSEWNTSQSINSYSTNSVETFINNIKQSFANDLGVNVSDNMNTVSANDELMLEIFKDEELKQNKYRYISKTHCENTNTVVSSPFKLEEIQNRASLSEKFFQDTHELLDAMFTNKDGEFDESIEKDPGLIDEYFNIYGSHLVLSVVMGAYIDMYYSLYSDSENYKLTNKTAIDNALNVKINSSEANVNVGNNTTVGILETLNYDINEVKEFYYVKSYGGSNELFGTDINSFSSDYNKWKNSLNDSSYNVVGFGRGGLVPIWDVITMKDWDAIADASIFIGQKNRAQKAQNAIKALYANHFERNVNKTDYERYLEEIKYVPYTKDINIVNNITEIERGRTKQIIANCVPADAVDGKITYLSSNPDCLQVNEEGYITGFVPGTYTIYLKAGAVIKPIDIKVYGIECNYSINRFIKGDGTDGYLHDEDAIINKNNYGKNPKFIINLDEAFDVSDFDEFVNENKFNNDKIEFSIIIKFKCKYTISESDIYLSISLDGENNKIYKTNRIKSGSDVKTVTIDFSGKVQNYLSNDNKLYIMFEVKGLPLNRIDITSIDVNMKIKGAYDDSINKL